MSSPVTTPGQVLLRDILPSDVQIDGPIEKDKLDNLFKQLAIKHPDKYVDILDRLNRVATTAATRYGNTTSVSLKDLELPPRLKEYRKRLQARVDKIVQNPQLSSKQKNEKVVNLMKKTADDIRKKVIDEGDKAGNKFVFTGKHGFRGNPVQLTQLLFGDLLMADHKGRPVPLPGLHGYGEGVSPSEFWAGTYGSRAGFSSVQLNTQKSGFLTKQLAMLPHRVRVTGEDCGAKDIGSFMQGDDPDLIGHVLAESINGLPKDIVITAKHLPKLQNEDDVMVRSLLTCQQQEGVCKKCAGLRETGKFPGIGDFIGVESARFVGEPLTQKMLCLAPDTFVRKEDDTPIQLRDLHIGDTIRGVNKEGTYEPVKVTDIFYHTNKLLDTFWMDNGEIIVPVTCSYDHKFLTETNEILPIRDIQKRELKVYGGFDIISSKQDPQYDEAMDIEVDNEDHLFVLANGLIVSNSSKHTGGIVGETDETSTGFDAITQLFQIPGHFKGGAVLSPTEGKITQITKAPQGGKYVMVGTEQVFIPENRKLNINKDDHVEPGDALSSGLVNPREIVEYKGIGAGREYFMKQLHDMLKKNGVETHKRNLEPIAREFFNRVEITNPEGYELYTMGDVVPYSEVQRIWKPRNSAYVKNAKYAKGKYLEKPVLNFSIGTRITPSVVKRLDSKGIDNVLVNDNPPPFKPKAVRLQDVASTDPDFKARMGAWGLKKGFLQAAQSGSESPHENTSFVPYLMDPSKL